MKKSVIRLLLALLLFPMSLAVADVLPEGEPCTRDTTCCTDGNGVPLVCYFCQSATYCYYN